MRFKRSSGLLLHPTACAGPSAWGDLGAAAHAFVDFLAAAGQSLWQVLPLGVTGFGDSPYQSFSAFAGNPLLVSAARLEGRGLLAPGTLERLPGRRDTGADFGAAHEASRAVASGMASRLGRVARELLDRFRARTPWLTTKCTAS